MGFFDGVLGCNSDNGGSHQWGEPEKRTSELTGKSDYAQRCGGCGVTAWGNTPQEAMGRAQDADRAHRRGLFG